jgi:hypothetical protein
MVWGRALLPVQRAQLASCRQLPKRRTDRRGGKIDCHSEQAFFPAVRNLGEPRDALRSLQRNTRAFGYSNIPQRHPTFNCLLSLIFQAALRGVLWLEFLLAAVQQLLSFAAFATPRIVQPRFERCY